MDDMWIIGGIAGAIIILLLAGTLMKSIRFAGITCIKIIIGAVVLYILNAAGAQWNLHIPINPVTAAVCGLLGLPGLGALTVIQLYILPH